MNKTKHAVAVVAVVVGRVSDSVTRQLADADIFGDVGLRDETANPTYGTGWHSLALDNLFDLVNGYAFKSADFVQSGIPVIKIRNVKPNSLELSDFSYVDKEFINSKPDKLLRNGDILITMSGNRLGGTKDTWVGKVAYFNAPGHFLLNQRVGVLRPKSGIELNKRCCAYFLSSDVYQNLFIAIATSSGGQANLSPHQILSEKILLPSLDEQNSIAELLGAIDDKIALLRETNATLEAIAQALFKSWFVNFDPVRARAEGHEPEGIPPDIAALFPREFEDSVLGEIPKGWKLVPFGELLNLTIGGDWGSDTQEEKNDTRVAIIRGTDIPDLQSGTNSRVPIRYTSQKKLSTRKLQDGDIVLEVSGGSKDQPTGRAIYLTEGILGHFDCPVVPASFCRLLRPIAKDIGILLGQHLVYIYAQGRTWEYQNQSTGIANFQTTHFLETELVAIPPDEVLAAFASIVRPMIERSHLTQIKQLAALRDTLLPRLMSGKLRITKSELAPEEVAL